MIRTYWRKCVFFLPLVRFTWRGGILVLQTNYYTGSQMKAYKSQQTYNHFVCSWVSDLGSKAALNDCRLVFALVSKCDSESFSLDLINRRTFMEYYSNWKQFHSALVEWGVMLLAVSLNVKLLCIWPFEGKSVSVN